MDKTGLKGVKGDGDPLDIVVLTEKSIHHGDILVTARPIGGFRMIDGNEADDKIIAVLNNDFVYGHFKDLADVPETIITRLRTLLPHLQRLTRRGEKFGDHSCVRPG